MFIKQFRIDRENGIVLLNDRELNIYISNHIEHFSRFENYSSKVEVFTLLDEILQMCDYDIATSTFDTSVYIIRGQATLRIAFSS